MNRIITAVATLFVCSLQMPAQTLEVQHLASNNAIVRFSPNQEARYLLIPIEEKSPESDIKVICGNSLARTLNVHLAFDRVDYYGYGPFESYIDKRQASYMGSFSAKISDMHEDYIRPQETGSHYGCSKLSVTDGRTELCFTAPKTFSFNASEYTQEELADKRHNFELEKCGFGCGAELEKEPACGKLVGKPAVHIRCK